MLQVLFINNDGAGFADKVDIDPDTTITRFFENHMDGNPADYLIRVNREAVESNFVLRDGDRVSITPTKIDGAM